MQFKTGLSGNMELLEAHQWVQFQYYGLGGSGISLMTAGLIGGVGIVEVGVGDDSFRVYATHVAEVASDGRSWKKVARQEPHSARERELHGVSVMCPASAIRGAWLTPQRQRLVVLISHPKETSLLVLFQQQDTGEEELFEQRVQFSKLVLAGIESM